MTLAAGIKKVVAYAPESTFGVMPSAGTSQSLRHKASNIDLAKDVYQSAEMRSDYQISDYRHGVRRVKGPIEGELSPKTYADFFAAALKRPFAAGASISGASITVAGSGPIYTVGRAAGSYLTDGIKVGDVVRLSVGAFNVANLNKNLMVTQVTASVLSVMVVNSSALVPEGPVTGGTVTVQGKKTFIPSTGHVETSFSIEHFYSDIGQSEVFTGCKVDKIALALPPTGMATIALDWLGQNVTTAQSQYFTNPTAQTTTGVVAAVNGVCRVAGSVAGILTGLTLDLDPGFTGDPVVGSNVIPNLFPDTVDIKGQMTAYFLDGALRDAFLNESEIDLYIALSCDNTASSDFLAFSLPRIKLGGATKADAKGGLTQTLPFQALLNKYGGAGIATEYTTFSVQDSAA